MFAACLILMSVCPGTVPLEIETGRYVGIPAEQKICKLCRGAVEDEVHFWITCPALVLPRIPLLQAMDSITPGFKGLCDNLDTPCCTPVK